MSMSLRQRLPDLVCSMIYACSNCLDWFWLFYLTWSLITSNRSRSLRSKHRLSLTTGLNWPIHRFQELIATTLQIFFGAEVVSESSEYWFESQEISPNSTATGYVFYLSLSTFLQDLKCYILNQKKVFTLLWSPRLGQSRMADGLATAYQRCSSNY